MSFVMDYLSGSSKDYYTTTEVAILLRLHPDTVRNWIRANQIAVSKTPGGHRRIDRVTVMRIGASCNQT